jgi:hypothetical protein
MAPPKSKQVVPEGRRKETAPQRTPGVVGRNDKADPNNGALYRDQLRQLHIELNKRLRARAISNWALNFFAGNPDIPQIAKALSAKVDSALLAVNRGTESLKAGFIFDLTNWVPLISFRDRIDFVADLYLKRSRTSWLITYRIPRAVAVATEAVEDKRGKCEEHAFLAVYLLTIGHMIQNQPFGRLKNDIYFTGAATPKHAMVILVKGAEFKKAISESKKRTGKVDYEWLRKNTHRWGKSAWIVDGWDRSRSKKLSGETIQLDYSKTSTFRRDPKSGGISKWDLNVEEMVKRVSTDYKL